MKLWTLVIITLVPYICKAQYKDTAFIYKSYDKKYKSYHAIFIDPNKNSKRYQLISEFNFDINSKFNFDKVVYSDGLKALKGKSKQPFKKTHIIGIPKRWCLLRLYQGKYYVYSPSDWGDNYRHKFTDSTFIQYTTEGPEPSLIKSFKKTENHTFEVSHTTWTVKQMVTTIHIIDSNKGIAVFENVFDHNSGPLLMIDADHVKDFPLIVNFCNTNRVDELKFQKPDFKKLIAESSKKLL